MSALAKEVFEKLQSTGNILVTAESCTGGMIAAAMTDLSGSSAIFDRGFVTYSNDAKMDHLGVQSQTLEQFGAVSEQTAIEMANGALQHSNATIAISVTGIAGPSGGSDEKPVGLVYIGLAQKDAETIVVQRHFDGDRASIRAQTRDKAFTMLLESLD